MTDTNSQECFTKSPKNPNIPWDLPDETSQFSSEINSFGEILPDEKTDNSAQKVMLFETFWQMKVHNSSQKLMLSKRPCQMKAHNSPQKLILLERFCRSDSAPQMKLFFLSTCKKNILTQKFSSDYTCKQNFLTSNQVDPDWNGELLHAKKQPIFTTFSFEGQNLKLLETSLI